MQHEVWPYVKMSLIINHITINGISYIKRGSLYLPLYSNSVSKILMENFYIETFFFFFFVSSLSSQIFIFQHCKITHAEKRCRKVWSQHIQNHHSATEAEPKSLLHVKVKRYLHCFPSFISLAEYTSLISAPYMYCLPIYRPYISWSTTDLWYNFALSIKFFKALGPKYLKTCWQIKHYVSM